MWTWIIVIVVIGGAIWIWAALAAARKSNEIIECAICSNRMTRGNFKARGGCPRCGSDLMRTTGQQAGRD